MNESPVIARCVHPAAVARSRLRWRYTHKQALAQAGYITALNREGEPRFSLAGAPECYATRLGFLLGIQHPVAGLRPLPSAK